MRQIWFIAYPKPFSPYFIVNRTLNLFREQRHQPQIMAHDWCEPLMTTLSPFSQSLWSSACSRGQLWPIKSEGNSAAARNSRKTFTHQTLLMGYFHFVLSWMWAGRCGGRGAAVSGPWGKGRRVTENALRQAEPVPGRPLAAGWHHWGAEPMLVTAYLLISYTQRKIFV